MKIYIVISFVVMGLVIFVLSCNNSTARLPGKKFAELIPSYIKDTVYLSPENPFSIEKANLGRYFFYDRRLSFNQIKACASCHDPKFSFTDSYRRSTGATGDNLQHNAPALVNLVFNQYLTHADSTLHFPEQQINNPLFHSKPVEMGWKGNEALIISRLKKDAFYSKQIRAAFPGEDDPFTAKNIQFAITCFVKTILSFQSSFDRYQQTGNENILTATQKKGKELFFSARLACSNCHSGINFSTPVLKDEQGRRAYYQNTGLYNIDSNGAYPLSDRGLIELTGNRNDMGKYRIPTLRNLLYTAPYFHDGSAATLDDVINVYEQGGRLVLTGSYAGDGRMNPFKNNLITGFRLTSQEKYNLIQFLLSLSDSSVCNNPLYANPFKQDETKN